MLFEMEKQLRAMKKMIDNIEATKETEHSLILLKRQYKDLKENFNNLQKLINKI